MIYEAGKHKLCKYIHFRIIVFFVVAREFIVNKAGPNKSKACPSGQFIRSTRTYRIPSAAVGGKIDMKTVPLLLIFLNTGICIGICDTQGLKSLSGFALRCKRVVYY
jgi:hypothetical protein